MKNRVPLVLAGLLNLVALSFMFIVNVSWNCKGDHDNVKAAPEYVGRLMLGNAANNKRMLKNSTAAPAFYAENDIVPSYLHWAKYTLRPALGNATNNKTMLMNSSAAPASDAENNIEPSYLHWDPSTPPAVPAGWKFGRPRFCKEVHRFRYNETLHGNQTVIVHYHMQHSAGTMLWGMARPFVPCALRSCWQTRRHCLVSYDEDVEAGILRENFRRYGVQYHSYEVMLPPRFPLPFVGERARRGLFFTTTVRDPFQRFVSSVRRFNYTDTVGYREDSPFWMDLQTGNQGPYAMDNLIVRWLSGAQGRINNDHVNIAKCRLQLFDLVIADKLYQHAVKMVICPLNGWRGGMHCNYNVSDVFRRRKTNPLDGTDPLLIGAWAERLRPSFEVYDYARILSWRQMRERGVGDLPPLSEVPSYLETLARYANLEVTDAHLKGVGRVSVENEGRYRPPVEFCDEMKRVWTSNPDEVPNVYGIGSLSGDGPFLMNSGNT